MPGYVDRVNRASHSLLKASLGCAAIAVLCLGGCVVLGLISTALSVSRPRPVAPIATAPPAPAPAPAHVPAVVASEPAPSLPTQAMQSEPVAAVPVYRLLREEPVEDRQKAQVDGRLLVDATLDPSALRAVLGHYLSHARGRAGWRRHERTTRVYAYAYASEADANGSGAGWVAMLTWRESTGDAEPVIAIDEERLEQARHPVEREGLPEARRREIHRALWEADYASARAGRAEDDANARRVARRFGVSPEQVQQIGIEGIQRGW